MKSFELKNNLPKPIVEQFYRMFNFVITFRPCTRFELKNIHFSTYCTSTYTYNIILYYFRFESSKKGTKKLKSTYRFYIPFHLYAVLTHHVKYIFQFFWAFFIDLLPILFQFAMLLCIPFCLLLKTHWEFYWSLDEDVYDAAEVDENENTKYILWIGFGCYSTGTLDKWTNSELD